MYREIFTKLNNDLNSFNPNELIFVTYDKSKHLLTFRQSSKMIMLPYLSPFFFSKKGFKLGILTQNGLNKLRYGINSLLSSNLLDKEELVPNINTLSMDWYRYYGTATVPYPTKFITLKFVNITNSLVIKLLCKFGNNETKLMYKILKNESKMLKNGKKE